ncbi:MAG: OmpA family protein [Acidobacteriota bacterium]|nr:OmpA family protein [Acidobacteriota bacterium]
MKSAMSLICVVGLAGALASGCVSNKKFEGTMSGVTGRVDGLQGTVEEYGEQIGQLRDKDGQLEQNIGQVQSEVGQVRTTSMKAMETADAASAAARGKVLWSVTLTNKDVTFAVDGTVMKPDGVTALDQLIDRLKSYDKMVFVEIQGHTDSTGSDAYNLQLGEKRAQVVRNHLHERGIPLNLISVISYGEARPIADNSSRDGRAANRRVEVLVLE